MTCALWAAHMFVAERIGDPEIGNMLRHLWAEHPDVLREPAVLPLAELMRLVRVRMV